MNPYATRCGMVTLGPHQILSCPVGCCALSCFFEICELPRGRTRTLAPFFPTAEADFPLGTRKPQGSMHSPGGDTGPEGGTGRAADLAGQGLEWGRAQREDWLGTPPAAVWISQCCCALLSCCVNAKQGGRQLWKRLLLGKGKARKSRLSVHPLG